MSDHIHIEKGQDPWQPSESSELTEIFHSFTNPLVGLIKQSGITYLFWCVVGHNGPESAWAYARVDEGRSLEALRSATNDDFDEALVALAKDRASSFAIASEDKGIVEWVVLEPPASFEDAHERGMEELGAKVSEAMAEMEHLLEQFPSIRAVRSFSVTPSPRLSA